MIDIVVRSMTILLIFGGDHTVAMMQPTPINFQTVADNVSQLSIGKRPDSTKLKRPNKRNWAGLSEWTTASNVS
jgi:hypothetical protein